MEDDLRDFKVFINLLIILSSTALVFSASFSEYISLSDAARWFLASSWFLFIISIVFGIFLKKTLLDIMRAKNAKEGESLYREVHTSYLIQMVGFVFGVLSLTICTMWPLFTQIVNK